MKILYLIICFSLISCGRTELKKEITFIDPREFVLGDINISEFAQSINYIPLSTKKMMSFINTHFIGGDKIFVATGGGSAQICVFDINGEYLNDIGKKGRGPGEYRYAHTFTIDNEGQRVYVYDSDKILVYADNGKFLYDFKIPVEQSRFTEIRYQNGKIYLFGSIDFGHSHYNWIITDTVGNIHSIRLNHIPPFKSQNGFALQNIFKLNNSFGYWNFFNDTIYNVSIDTFSVRYLFANGDFRVTPEVVDNSEYFFHRCWRPHMISESVRFLFIRYNISGKKGFALLDKKRTNIFKSMEIKIKGHMDNTAGFINDIDGGLPLSDIHYHTENGNEYLVGRFFPYELKAHVSSDTFKNSTPKYPEKKRELERLANSLSENDNPVLMIVKLKE
jgi:hypothetical protein